MLPFALGALWIIAGLIGTAQFTVFVGNDAQAYRDGIYGPYGLTHGGIGYFVYSPVIWQLFEPFRSLSVPVFVTSWSTILLGAWAVVGGPFLWLAPGPISIDVGAGNIYGLMALALILASRYPAAWSFLILTKVTPGIGVLWYAFRREWQNLAVALGFTFVVSLVSLVMVPDLWRQWLGWLVVNAQTGVPSTTAGAIPIPLLPRLGLALGVLYAGARLDQRWILPIVVMLAVPSLQTASFSLLLAMPPVALLGLLADEVGPELGRVVAVRLNGDGA